VRRPGVLAGWQGCRQQGWQGADSAPSLAWQGGRVAKRQARCLPSSGIAIGALLATLVWGLIMLAPFLLALAVAERRSRGRRLSLLTTPALLGAAAWLWRELRRHPFEPRGPWHPCEQCGIPISDESRARYCSTGCRRLGRLRQAAARDDRAAARLARLEQPMPAYDPATAEIPF
jgi:hypothetical protein